MSKYTEAKYPDKINDLIDNEGRVHGESVVASGVTFLTEAPTAPNLDGDVKFVWLQEEPAERFDGYYYLIGNGQGGGGGGEIAIGSRIKINNDYKFFVIDMQEDDLTNVEVLLISHAIPQYRWYSSSPSGDQLVTWQLISGSIATGAKYKDSLMDQACTTLYNQLPADIQSAILPTNVTQDYLANTMSPSSVPTGGYLIDTGSSGTRYCRYPVTVAPVEVGSRYLYLPSINIIEKMCGKRVVTTSEWKSVMPSACRFIESAGSSTPMACISADSYLSTTSIGAAAYTSNIYYAAMHIDLTKVDYKMY